jgi:predicted DNA-binding transcriptional regulator AlpA
METRLLDTHEVASYTHFSEAFIKKDRAKPINERQFCSPIIIGTAVRYDINDVDKWIDEHKR